MDRYIFTILIAFAINPTFISSKPLFWLRTTTTTTAATTTSDTSNTSTGTNSSTYNFNNGNSASVPLSVTQTGSTVDKAIVTTIDQYIGDLQIAIPTGRRARSIRTIFTPDTANYTSDIQNCINQYPFDYQTALNKAVASVISCISGDSSRSFSDNSFSIINRKTIFNGGLSNISQCAGEASDAFAQEALDAAQNVNDCIANGGTTSTTSTTTTTTTTSAATENTT